MLKRLLFLLPILASFLTGLLLVAGLTVGSTVLILITVAVLILVTLFSREFWVTLLANLARGPPRQRDFTLSLSLRLGLLAVVLLPAIGVFGYGQPQIIPRIIDVRGAGIEVDAAMFGASPNATAAANTTAINTALTQYRSVKLTRPGTYLINDSIELPAGRTLSGLPGLATVLKLANASNTYPVVSKNFTPGTTSVAGSTTTTGTLDGITVKDLTIDVNASNQTTAASWPNWRGHAMLLWNTSNLRLENLKVINGTSGGYACFIVDFNTCLVRNFTILNGPKDGVHCIKGTNIHIDGVYGQTNDDSVIVNTSDWPVVDVAEGNVANVTIENVNVDSGNHIVTCWGDATYTFSKLNIRNIRGSTLDASAVVIKDTAGQGNAGPSQFDDISISDVQTTTASGSFASVSVGSAVVKTLRLSGITNLTPGGRLVQFDSGADIETVTGTGITSVYNCSQVTPILVNTGADVSVMSLSNLNIRGTSCGGIQNNGLLGTLLLNNVYFECTSGTPSFVNQNAVTTTNVLAENVRLNQASGTFGYSCVSNGGILNVYHGNLITNGAFNRVRVSTGSTVNLFGHGEYTTDEVITTNRISNNSQIGTIRISWDKFNLTPSNAGLNGKQIGDVLLNNITTLAGLDGRNMNGGVAMYNGLGWQRRGQYIYWKAHTVDFPSISAGSYQEVSLTWTVPTEIPANSAAGDQVFMIAPSTLNAGVLVQAKHVPGATNQVTLTAFNATGSPVDPASATYYVGIGKP